MTRPAATISLDLDDLWSYRRSFGLPEAAATPSLLPVAIPRFLEFMRAHGLHGTVFVVGRDAEQPRHAGLLARIGAAGHELGNHSHEHAGDIESWSMERQHADLTRAHAAIAAASGFAPRGFRGPSFRVSPQLLEVVQALGYRYDASTFPNALGALARRWQRRRAGRLGTQAVLAADSYGSGDARRMPLAPHAWDLAGGALIEVPVTTLPGLRIPIHGTYLQFLADHSAPAARVYARAALALLRAARVEPHYLLHATDFIGCDDPFDCAFFPGMRRPWRDKVALLSVFVARLRDAFAVMPIDAYVTQLERRGDLRKFAPGQLTAPR